MTLQVTTDIPRIGLKAPGNHFPFVHWLLTSRVTRAPAIVIVITLMLDPSGSPPKKMASEAGLSELDKYSTNPGLAAAWRKLVICSTTSVCAVQREAEASEYRQPIQVRRERERGCCAVGG
jgi:hypothetical protein